MRFVSSKAAICCASPPGRGAPGGGRTGAGGQKKEGETKKKGVSRGVAHDWQGPKKKKKKKKIK